MEKDGVVELHEKILRIREELETKGKAEESTFDKYNQLEVSPRDQPHQWSKDEHEDAIYCLVGEMMEHISEQELDEADSLRERMSELRDDLK